MTANRKAPVQIKVTSRTATVQFYGHTSIDGRPAMLIIAIILTFRAVRLITLLTFRFLVWFLPILFRFSLRASAEIYTWTSNIYRAC